MKQTIEIEVPSGKKAVWENNQIIFVESEPHWESITTFKDAMEYCRKSKHLSKYFGKLIFEVMYGGINCDWKWVE